MFRVWRSNEEVKLKELVMIRALRRVEPDAARVVIVTEVSRGWVWFRARVGRVEPSANLADNKSPVGADLIMNEVNRYCNVLDSGGDFISVKDVDAGFAVFIDRGWKEDLARDSNGKGDVLCVHTALDAGEDPSNFGFGGMKGDTTLLIVFPVNCDAIE